MVIVKLDFGIRTGYGPVTILDLIIRPINGRVITPHQTIHGTPVTDKSILIIMENLTLMKNIELKCINLK